MTHGFCSPEQVAVCPLQEHFTDEHHLFYPRFKYKTRVEKKFRNLPQNKIQLCRSEHSERHATEPIPVKPSTAEMREAIAQSALRGANHGETILDGREISPPDTRQPLGADTALSAI